MVSETLSHIQTNIETILFTNELQFKSVRVANYREASYFAFDGNYVYLIIDCTFSGSPTFCYVGETTNLGPNLRAHARNHRFSHAFVIDLGESEAKTRHFVKNLLVEKFDPIFQGMYNPFKIYRTNNFQRCLSTDEIRKWNECRLASRC